MADTKISALTGATTPLDGTEVLPVVQSGTTKKVANNDLRPKQIQSNATSGVLQVAGPAAASTRVMTVPNANFTAARTDAAQTFTGDQVFSDAIGQTKTSIWTHNLIGSVSTTASGVAAKVATITPNSSQSIGRTQFTVVGTNSDANVGYCSAAVVYEVLYSRYGGNATLLKATQLSNNIGSVNAGVISLAIVMSAAVVGSTIEIYATPTFTGAVGATVGLLNIELHDADSGTSAALTIP